MSRSTEQRDLDRQALVDVLKASDGRMYTKEVIAAAQGVHISQVAPIYAQAYADLRFLKKAGVLDSTYFEHGSGGKTSWWFVGDLDLDAEADRREVERLVAGWEVAR